LIIGVYLSRMDFETIRSFHKPLTPNGIAARYPGFYSDECYEILADYLNTRTVPNKNNKRKLEELEESDSGTEESKENVSSAELIITQCEPTPIIQGSIQG
jgi:hypothetical protein